MHILDDLAARGLIEQCSDLDTLKEHLSTGSRTLYCGFDPTADSLHIGSLVPLLTLKRYQLAGHRPLVLVGGATGLIGDPSFKAAERQLNSDETVSGWAEKLKTQTSKFVNFNCGDNSAEVVNNLDWTGSMSVIEFLRDIGKAFSVNMMLNKESVKQRIERPESGISFTEFSYSILQSMDFAHLNKTHNCTLQIGGSDQWGNMTGGIDLTRRSSGNQVYVQTLPLVTKSDGTKFGKTESGTIWLDGAKTSPYAFYQFWINTADDDVEKFLKMFTFMTIDDINTLVSEHAEAPHKRVGQKRLAEEITTLVHGEAALNSAKRITEALFGGDLSALTEEDLRQLRQDGMPASSINSDSVRLIEALVSTKLAGSNREARDFIKGNAVSSNGEKIADLEGTLTGEKALYGKYHILKRGKKNYHLLELSA